MLGWSHKLYVPPLNFLWLFGRTSPLITSDQQPPRGLSGFQSWKIYPLWLPVNHRDTEMAIRRSHLKTTRWADRLERQGKADQSADSRHTKIREKLHNCIQNPHVSLCKEVRSPGPEHRVSSKNLTWVTAHAGTPPEDKVCSGKNCLWGWCAEKHIPCLGQDGTSMSQDSAPWQPSNSLLEIYTAC